MTGFLFGLIIGIAAGGYLAYRYRSTIESLLDKLED